MLDIKPEKGHRVLMQSYPGGIESGTDWYQNDVGVVLTETTIRQSPFNAQGTPVAYRARKAIQYGDDIDKVVEYLSTRNNGLYTNEWLMGDAKTNEIAMFELGTNRTKLWRSSKNEWFGGTEGFYWGDNNAKDLNVRLEYEPDPHGEPEFVPYVPMVRDLAWQKMYEEHRGKIDEQFAFLAFRSAPLVSAATMDAKVLTADMASKMMVWAAFGKPNQTPWVTSERHAYAKNDGLYPSGYRLFTTAPPASTQVAESHKLESPAHHLIPSTLWTGWVLPATNADDWFVAGSVAYHNDLESGNIEDAVQARWAAYRRLQLEEPNERTRYEIEKNKGAIFLDSLRSRMGDAKFVKLMQEYFDANTTKRVTAQSFLKASGVTFEMPTDKGGAIYLASDLTARARSAIIVYGTGPDAGANRYAAEKVQKRLYERFQSTAPIRKDFEVTEAELKSHDVVFVGRPESNSALAALASKLGLNYSEALFRIADSAHAHGREALVYTAANPFDRTRMVLVMAGNDALDTVLLASQTMPETQYAIYDSGTETSSGFLP